MIPVWLMFYVGSSAGGEICEQPLFEPSTDRVLTPERCTSVGGSGSSPALGIALVALLMIAPIAVSILLARRMKKPAVAAV